MTSNPDSNGRRYLTWAWLSGVLITIVLALLMMGISDVKGDITDFRANHVTRVEWVQIQSGLDQQLRDIRDDQRQILQLLLDAKKVRP